MREIELLRERHAVSVVDRQLWGIADSRSLMEEIYKTEGSGRPRAFALICGDITVEAQNALLKVVEEPPAHSRIIFFLAPEATLLPTLRSRVQMVSAAASSNSKPTPVFIEWEQLSLREKMSAIETRIKKKDDAWIEQLVRGAQATLQKHYALYPATTSKRLFLALELVGTRGASNKMLLEEIALLFSTGAKRR